LGRGKKTTDSQPPPPAAIATGVSYYYGGPASGELVGTMFFGGTKAGATVAMGQVEAGLSYMEMMEWEGPNGEKVDPGIARLVALGVGAVNGSLEALQIKGLSDTASATGQAINRYVRRGGGKSAVEVALGYDQKKYAAGIGEQTTQEILQEITTMLGVGITASASIADAGEMSKDEYLDYAQSQVRPAGKRLAETGWESIKAFTVLGGAANISSYVQGNEVIEAWHRQYQPMTEAIKNIMPEYQAEEIFTETDNSFVLSTDQIVDRDNFLNIDKFKESQARIQAARDQSGPRRAPIRVVEMGTGEYRVVDGQHTTAALRAPAAALFMPSRINRISPG
jgi:hypothetical protein